MIEVTDEMINAGTRAWIEYAPGRDPHKAFASVYRAMRALEPKAEPLRFGRQTAYRPEFAGEAQSAPDPRGRLFSDTVAARKAVDPEFREALEAEFGQPSFAELEAELIAADEPVESIPNNAQIPAKEINPLRIMPDGSVRVETPTGAQNVGQFGFASAIYKPAEVLAKKIGTPQESVCRPYNIQDEIEALNLRVVALERAVWRS